MLVRIRQSLFLSGFGLRSMLVAGLVATHGPANAETLQEALAAAYTNNPTLESGRSEVRAVDENVAIANSGFRPRIGAGGTASWEKTTIGGDGSGVTVDSSGNLTQGGINRQVGYGIGLSQPIFTGFQTTNQLLAAEADVRGAREGLRQTESSVLLQAVAAYVGVIATQEIVKAYEQNYTRLDQEYRLAKERVELAELTDTDLAQAELRRTTAVASIASARADHKSARASYLEVVGHEPSNLTLPNVPRGVPKSLSEAQSIALREHPLIGNSLYNEESARHTVERIRGQLLPQVTLEASWSDEYNTSGVSFQRDTLVLGRVTAPLYEGGEVHASVRQAKQLHLSRLQTIEASRLLVQRSVATAWSLLEAARSRVDLGTTRIRASEVALKGVRKEEEIGQRSLLDILNAEQDVVDARVALISARRELIVASYEVLAQIGRLSAQELSLPTMTYDPTVHYEEVRRKWFGLDITEADGSHQHIVVEDRSGDHVPAK